MRLVCPSCASEYEVDESLFPEEGREVQCSNCDEVWVQYPVRPEPPLRLDPLAAFAAANAPREERASARPSERLPEDERAELAAAVRDEIAMRGVPPAPPPASGRPAATGEEEVDDEAILAALRAQIAAEGGDFSADGGAKSQKRNLKVAAEAAGVQVDAPDPREAPRKWTFGEETEKAPAVGRRDGLAEALKAYEKEATARHTSRGLLGRGFRTGLVLVVLAGGVVMVQDMIIEAYPPAAPVFEKINAGLAQARAGIETLYAEQIAPLIGKPAEAPAEGAPSSGG